MLTMAGSMKSPGKRAALMTSVPPWTTRWAAFGLLLVAGCGGQIDGSSPGQASTSPAPEARAEGAPQGQTPESPAEKPFAGDADVVELEFPYGSEKKNWLEAVTKRFNDAGHTTASGRRIRVKSFPIGSGSMTRGILDGEMKAHLASPASGVFVVLGNAESMQRTGRPMLGRTQSLVVSPVVIAMWKPMAEAIGWGKKPVGWSEILELVRSPEGWAKYGYPQWGRFKFGHTHPDHSNSGIISLFAEAYAGVSKATGQLKVAGLTVEDVARPEVGQFLQEIESSVVHYGISTGFFGDKMFANGPQFLSAAVLYESLVIESYDPENSLPFPVVAVYPKEGTFWSDHPVGIVQRDWVTEEHQEAAEQYIKYLLDRPQQEEALQYGFRPADPDVPLGPPLDAAHGVDPDQPQTTLAVPSATVMKAIQDLFRKHKKRSNVVLVLDTSASMWGEKLSAVKSGSHEMANMLGEGDLLSLMDFSSTYRWRGQGLALRAQQDEAHSLIDACRADGETRLYDSVAAAHRYLRQQPTPEKITAIVVLSDGRDNASRVSLAELVKEIRPAEGSDVISVFTIGYGEDADAGPLKEIAEATKAKYYEGTVETVREVFLKISTFF